MNFSNYIIPVIILIWIIWRQMSPRMVTKKTTLYLIIMIIGIVSVVGVNSKPKISFTATGIVIMAATLIVSTVLLGALRAFSYHMWVADDGLVMRRGTIVTILLWALSIAIHLGGDHFVPGSDVFTTFYIGLSLLIQRESGFYRAKRRFPNEIHANVAKMAERDKK
jgi:hypothetical protein